MNGRLGLRLVVLLALASACASVSDADGTSRATNPSVPRAGATAPPPPPAAHDMPGGGRGGTSFPLKGKGG